MATATDRPLAFWLTHAEPEPDSARPSRDTVPAPPPSAGRYCLVAAERVATAPPPPASRVRACRQTDPCIVPPPGSDRRGAAGLVRVVEAGDVASNTEGKG